MVFPEHFGFKTGVDDEDPKLPTTFVIPATTAPPPAKRRRLPEPAVDPLQLVPEPGGMDVVVHQRMWVLKAFSKIPLFLL